MKTTLIIVFSVLVLGTGAIVVLQKKDISRENPAQEHGFDTPVVEELPAPQTPVPEEKPVVVNPGPTADQKYYFHTLVTTNVKKELSDLVGESNITAVLQTNRIDLAHIKQGSKVVIPVEPDYFKRSPFPEKVTTLESVSKIIFFSQKIQAFAAYENGRLVRWGPISSGKQSTKTPNGLFSTNWKGKEVKSTFDDEWILKYNFNIENFEGVGFHQYEMPGYPASHSCVRLLMEDAMWFYDWAEQWVLDPSGNNRLAHGTPVILFGDYGFGKTAPWKLLPENASATIVSNDEMEGLVNKYLDTIISRQNERKVVLGL